jgi:hypothetical protein
VGSDIFLCDCYSCIHRKGITYVARIEELFCCIFVDLTYKRVPFAMPAVGALGMTEIRFISDRQILTIHVIEGYQSPHI